MTDPDKTVPGLPQGEKWRCAKCGCLWIQGIEWAIVGSPCVACAPDSPFRIDNLQRVMEEAADALTITQEMSDASLTPVGSDQHAQDTIAAINEETEKEGNVGYIEGDESSPGTEPEFKG